MARIRQSEPDSGIDFEVQVRKIFRVVPSSLGSCWLKGSQETMVDARRRVGFKGLRATRTRGGASWIAGRPLLPLYDRAASLIRKRSLPGTTIGPQAWSCCTVLEGGGFL